MKKLIYLLAIALTATAAYAQKVNKTELAQMQKFLSQPAKESATNAEALNITNLKNPSTWEGVTIENGHITQIDWKDKKLAGQLDLTGLNALTSVDI